MDGLVLLDLGRCCSCNHRTIPQPGFHIHIPLESPCVGLEMKLSEEGCADGPGKLWVVKSLHGSSI